MTADTAAGGALLAAAVIVSLPAAPAARKRLAVGVRHASAVRRQIPTGRRPGSGGPVAPGSRARQRATVGVGGLLAGALAWLLVGGIAGWVGGAVVAALTIRLLCRLYRPDRRTARAPGEGQLPFALDLVAACLRCGQDATRAAGTVGTALGGEIGTLLMQAAGAGAIGTPPEQAWSALTTLTGGAAAGRRVALAMTSGTELAAALGDLAADLRAARASGREASVRRAGVLVVLPLGLCFLPAFVCLSVIPVAAGLLTGVLAT